ncbi:type II toxin-antitoxin system RelB/DinJ family antitoxin [Candidatus Saccharibacteria bacterium]|nr:type II toxin-antitoxin system RelB/DinJ family antitoxin [Candidatus Saccharibacteria bacterium]
MSSGTTIPIQIRVDKKTKEEANELFEELGTSMSGAINIFLKQCVNTGSIPFRIKKPRPSKELLEAMEEVEALAKEPDVEVYNSFEEYQAAMKKVLDEDE